MRFPTPLLLVPPLLLAAACAKPRFLYAEDPAFPRGDYRTLALDPRRDQVLIREGLRPVDPGPFPGMVLVELEHRNYRAVSPAEADLWVAVYVLAPGPGGRGEGSRGGHRGGAGEGRHGGGGHGAGPEGAPRGGRGGGSSLQGEGPSGGARILLVQLLDRKTGTPVWQAETALDPRQPGPESRQGIQGVVHDLMQPLRPRP